MKLLIVGSRSISDIDISEYISEKAELIISGGASGVDTIAEEYADKNKISKLILRPQYELYRRAAPLKRNDLMVDICDNIIVFGMENQKELNTRLIMPEKRASH